MACTECKRRKIKCSGEKPCRRCSQKSLECLYRSVKEERIRRAPRIVHGYIEDLRNEVASLRTQLGGLRNQHSRMGSSTLGGRAQSPSAPTLLAPYSGPTTPGYCIVDVKSSLKRMGREVITPAGEKHEYLETMLPEPKAPSTLDPLWLIEEEEEALRLLNVYEEECHITYPVFDMHALREHLRSNGYWSALRDNQLTGAGNLHPWLAYDSQTDMLRLVLACGMKLDGRSHDQVRLSEELFNSVALFERIFSSSPLNLETLALLVVAATFQFWSGREVDAWKYIGLAARMSFGAGLHRINTLGLLCDAGERQRALRIFWVLYALDRRFSFGTGLPFAIQDCDVDSHLPLPDGDYPYLLYITHYNRTGTKIWTHVTGFRSGNPPRQNTAEYLDYLILRWYSELPDYLNFDRQDLTARNPIANRGLRRTRLLLRLRRNEARILIHRAMLHSTSCTSNLGHGKTLVTACKDTIETISAVNDVSDVYRSQEIRYNYFLKQAVVAIFLAAVRDPVSLDCQAYQVARHGLELLESSAIPLRSSGFDEVIRDLRRLEPHIGLVLPHVNDDKHSIARPSQSAPDRGQPTGASTPQRQDTSDDNWAALYRRSVTPPDDGARDQDRDGALLYPSGAVFGTQLDDHKDNGYDFFDTLVDLPEFTEELPLDTLLQQTRNMDE